MFQYFKSILQIFHKIHHIEFIVAFKFFNVFECLTDSCKKFLYNSPVIFFSYCLLFLIVLSCVELNGFQYMECLHFSRFTGGQLHRAKLLVQHFLLWTKHQSRGDISRHPAVICCWWFLRSIQFGEILPGIVVQH